jgi:hypothetical protein
MKKIILTTIILFSSLCCSAQLNNLSDNELFDGIKFNNVSLGDIMVASGDLTKMRNYFGNSIQESPNTTGPFLGKDIYNSKIYFHFEDETDTGNNYDLTYIKVKSNIVVVNVKGLSIKLYDDKSKFKDFLFNEKDSSYNFTDADTGSVGLSFKINKYNKVSEIELICF